MKLLAALACMALSACSANPFTDDATARQVNVGGKAYLISQLTAGTWTATASNPLTPLPDDTASRAALLRAIEKNIGLQGDRQRLLSPGHATGCAS